MLETVGLSIIAFIVAIGILVAVHEYGHFWVARRLGFKVQRFSIGFGRPLARWRGGAPDYTEYWISMLPLGGYVKLLDEREGPVPEEDRKRAFGARPVPHRIAVLLAGPGFNFLFAIIAYWALFVTGVPGLKPIIGAVTEGSVAAEAGLEPTDEIRAVGDRATDTWEAAVFALLDELLNGGRIDLTVQSMDGDTRRVHLDLEGRVSELTEPDALFPGLGFRPVSVFSYLPPLIDVLEPGEAAERAGLQTGDRILSADGRVMRNWDQWVQFVRQRPNETVEVRVLRDGPGLEAMAPPQVRLQDLAEPEPGGIESGEPGRGGTAGLESHAGGYEVDITLAIGSIEEAGTTIGRIGAGPPEPPPEWLERIVAEISAEQRYGVFPALARGADRTWEMTTLTVRFLGRMVTGDVSVRNVSGPIAIAGYAGDSAQAGLTAFLSFLGIVSISLAIINLLPIPLLDGGQIVYQVAEWIKGSPLSERALIVGQQVGLLMILALMVFVFYNDLARIFS